jgi:hypothetical protein
MGQTMFPKSLPKQQQRLSQLPKKREVQSPSLAPSPADT